MAISLPILDEAIARRAGDLAAAHPLWPCRKGCDDCCRSLAAVPLVTEAEWQRIAAALAAKPPAEAEALRSRIRASAGATRPVTCPLLDTATGACTIYAARPIACRTYGFYADRTALLGCHRIEAHAAEHPEIIWGNQTAIESDLDRLGPAAPLPAWLSA